MSTSSAPPRLSPEDVEEAAVRIAGRVRRTPILRVEPELIGLDVPLWLKLECLQVTGTFKPRNAFSLLLGTDVPDAGVVASSGGNFGAGVAYSARRLGHPATIFVPESTPQVKIDHMRSQGATVELVAGSYGDALTASRRRVEQTGALFAHPFDQPEIVAGAGTCGKELDEQCPDLDTVLVAVGGGGLIGGVAAWFGDRAQVIAVETDGTPTLHRALAAGGRVEVPLGGIAVSALGAPVLGELAWELARRWVNDSLLVADADVLEAQQRLWSTARIVAEPGGATAMAALTSGVYRPGPDERVGVIVCGANTDPGSFHGHRG